MKLLQNLYWIKVIYLVIKKKLILNQKCIE